MENRMSSKEWWHYHNYIYIMGISVFMWTTFINSDDNKFIHGTCHNNFDNTHATSIISFAKEKPSAHYIISPQQIFLGQQIIGVTR